MTDTAPARPPMLSLACFVIMVGGLSLLADMGRVLSTWPDPSTVRAVREFRESRGSRSTLSLETVLSIMHAFAYVCVPLAVAVIVLAVFVLRRHRASRPALTVLCVLVGLILLLSARGAGPLVAGFVVLLSVVGLWSRGATRWLRWSDAASADAPATPASQQSSSPSPVAGPDREEPTTVWPTATAGEDPRPSDVPRPTGSTGHPLYPGLPTPPPNTVPPTGSATSSRPGRPGVVWGASITAGLSSLLVLGFGLILVLAGTVFREPYRQAVQEDPQLRRQLAESSYTLDQLLDVVVVAGVVIAVLALLGLLASLAYVLHWPGGLAALCLMSAVAVASIITCVGLVVAVPAVVTIVLALRPDAREWSARR